MFEIISQDICFIDRHGWYCLLTLFPFLSVRLWTGLSLKWHHNRARDATKLYRCVAEIKMKSLKMGVVQAEVRG